jgi:hypothetical protein
MGGSNGAGEGGGSVTYNSSFLGIRLPSQSFLRGNSNLAYNVRIVACLFIFARLLA